MAKPHIHGAGRLFTATNILKTAGKRLGEIKRAGKLTYAEMGEVMAGRHEDRAAAYTNATADMGLVPFMYAAREWRGHFINPLLSLIGMHAVEDDVVCSSDGKDGRRTASALARLLARISAALEDDDVVDDSEVESMEAELLEARRHIDAKLLRIRRISLQRVVAA